MQLVPPTADSSLDDWLRWQECLHSSEIELGLERVRAVARRMRTGRPAPVVVTVAGTNGKGSTVALLESVYCAAGYRVGSYTSPHLLRYNERVRIDREPVADAALCQSFANVESARAREGMPLTYFEFGSLAAFDLLRESSLDIAILEVGLGGRLDAVNIIDADVAVITAIDLDHTQWLGTTREAIAREKAGVLRSGQTAICTDAEPPATIAECAQECGAKLLQLGRDFFYRRTDPEADGHWGWRMQGDWQRWRWPRLMGKHQLQNASGVLAVVEVLSARLPVAEAQLAKGLANIRLEGRFETQMLNGVELVFDVAHNPQAARCLSSMLAERPIQGRTLAVFGVLADKEIGAMAESLQQAVDEWFLAGLAGPRGKSLAEMESEFSRFASEAFSGFEQVSDALTAALKAAGKGDRVVVCGSFITVGDAKQALLRLLDSQQQGSANHG